MIIGRYPCCGEPLLIDPPEGIPLPRFYRHECEDCGVVVWSRLSRVDGWTLTEDDFLKSYKVDEITKSVELITKEEVQG